MSEETAAVPDDVPSSSNENKKKNTWGEWEAPHEAKERGSNTKRIYPGV